MCKKCKAIGKLLEEELKLSGINLRLKAISLSIPLKFALDIPYDKLVLYTNDADALTREIVKRRLAKEPVDVPEMWLKALYDVAFDAEEYKDIGVRDGILQMIQLVANKLGHKTKAKRAISLMYHAD